MSRLTIGALAITLAALIPFVTGTGTLLTLGLGFVFAAVALGFDITFGFTGLLSFGLVLYFAIGVYVFDITLSVWNWPLLPAIAATLTTGAIAATALGALSLRVRGIAFTMVTLAFAQAGYYLIEDNPHNLTGGDTGQVLTTTRLPAGLVGVASTRNLYWLALIFLIVIYAITWQATESVTGKVWLAIRESEQRTEVLGLKPFRYQLAALTLSSVIATAAGMVYLLLIGTATPDATAATTVTIEILVMVVLGGLGSRWGAVAGAIVYIYVQQELLKFAAEPSFANLPAPLRVPLSQPGFLLGALFIAFILFVPGGIASIRLRGKN